MKKAATKKAATKRTPAKETATRRVSRVPTRGTTPSEHGSHGSVGPGATDDATRRAGGVMEALSAMSLGFAITSPEKVVYPERGITKADVMGYLAWIAPRMLPFVAGRPLMLVRCPDGRGGQCFYQKHAGTGVPDPIRRVEIREKTDRGATLVVEDVAGLVALGQIGVLEIHTWMCMADAPERPDLLTLDLDPDPSVPFDAVVETALALRDVLARLEIPSFVKTTGGKGLHVVAPVAPVRTWEDHEAAARGIVSHLARAAPDRYVVVASKAARRGKIFLDWLRNLRGATAVAAYSLRAREGAPVALPIGWDALERGLDPSLFTLERLVGSGLSEEDPWRAWPSRAPELDPRRVAMLARSVALAPPAATSVSTR